MSSDRTDPYTRRPLTPADVPAWADLYLAIEAADHTGEHVGANELTELFEHPYCDFPRGSVAAFDADGAMAAFCYLETRTTADPVHDLRMEGGVHPEHRGLGLGTALLDWADRAAQPLHQERFPGRPLTLCGGALAHNTAAVGLFAAHGYRTARWFNDMRMDLARPLPESPVPTGTVFLPFAPERTEDARLVRNEAFLDHWGSTVSTPESWHHVVTGSGFRPELTFVAYAEAGGEPLALVLVWESEAHLQATGSRDLYIALVGTRRIGRRRGLASALLSHVLGLGREAGFATASLGVDADSPTGALGLYERLGFRAENVWAAQLKPLIPVPDAVPGA
jgi:mycothiol synthase